MSKLNSNIKPTSKFTDERLAGGSGALAAKQSNIALLKRLTLANLLWEDVAYCDGKKIAEEIERLIPLCSAEDVYTVALAARNSGTHLCFWHLRCASTLNIGYL